MDVISKQKQIKYTEEICGVVERFDYALMELNISLLNLPSSMYDDAWFNNQHNESFSPSICAILRGK